MTMGWGLDEWLSRDPREQAFFTAAWNQMNQD